MSAEDISHMRIIREIARCALDGKLEELSIGCAEEAWELILLETEGAE